MCATSANARRSAARKRVNIVWLTCPNVSRLHRNTTDIVWTMSSGIATLSTESKLTPHLVRRALFAAAQSYPDPAEQDQRDDDCGRQQAQRGAEPGEHRRRDPEHRDLHNRVYRDADPEPPERHQR